MPQTLDWGLRMAVLVSLPAALGLVVLAEPLTATLYQYGKFTAYDTRMAALALMALALGLPGFMVAKILAPGVLRPPGHAHAGARGAVDVAVNIVLCVAIVGPLWWFEVEGGARRHRAGHGAGGHAQRGAAVALPARRSGRLRLQPGWPAFLARVAFAVAAMVGLLLVACHEVGPWTALAAHDRMMHLAWLVPAGALAYGLALLAAGLRPRHLREPAAGVR